MVPVAEQDFPSFKLEKDSSGWHIPALPAITADSLGLNKPGYQAFLVPGLKAVKLDFTDAAGNNLTHDEWSQNGVSATNCSLFPGGSSYLGADVLELYSWIAVPEARPTNGVRGTITLYFDDAHTVWASYNVDGVKVASGADSPVRAIEPVSPSVSPLSSVPRSAVKLTVTGPAGPVTLEFRENLTDWQVLTVVTNSAGSVSTTDSATGVARFYRALLGGN